MFSRRVWMAILAIFQVIVCIYWRTFYNESAVGASIADYITNIFSPFFLGLILNNYLALAYMSEIRNHNRETFVLNFGSKEKLLNMQIKKAALFSAEASIIIVLVTFVMSSFMTSSFINWNSYLSIYYAATREINLYTNLPMVIIAAVAALFVRILLLSCLVLALWWAINQSYFVFVIITVVGCIELCTDIRMFNDFLSLDYDMWANWSLAIIKGIYTLIFLLLILFVTKEAVRKKEFI